MPPYLFGFEEPARRHDIHTMKVKSHMKQLSDVARPGILISNTWPRSRERQGETLAAIETVLERGFFQSFQTVEIPFRDERKAIARLMQAEGLPLTYCLTRVLNENGLNLSDLDEENRQRSYERTIQCLDDARQAGARSVSLISGPRPADPTQRAAALQGLADSMQHICRAAQADPALKIILEPLDWDTHKKCTLGLVEEAVAICKQLRLLELELNLCIDTAHMILNGEDPVESLGRARAFAIEFHYCNCVTDRSHPLFGDLHLPFGSPGVLDIDGMAHIMREGIAMGFFNAQDRPVVACEVLKREGDESLWVMQHGRDALQQAWDITAALLT